MSVQGGEEIRADGRTQFQPHRAPECHRVIPVTGHPAPFEPGAIRPGNQSVETQTIPRNTRQTANRGPAGAVKSIQHGAFGQQAGQRVGVIEQRQRPGCVFIVIPPRYRDDALTRCGQHLIGFQDRIGHLRVSKPVEASQRQQGDIGLTIREFPQSRFHVPAKQHHIQIGTLCEKLGLTPLGGRADPGTPGDCRNRGRTDQRIARIFAFQRGADHRAFGEPGFHVLGRVHRDIHLPVEQSPVDLLGEQALAPGISQRAIGNRITGRADRDNLCLGRAGKCLGQQAAHHARLGQRQWAAAGPYSKWLIVHTAPHSRLRREGKSVFRNIAQPHCDLSSKLGYIRPMNVLGIETSCDETAAAIVCDADTGGGTILSNVVLSQLDDHRPFGGVVPEIAARAHLDHLDSIIARALDDADMTLDAIDGVAATAGPGLIGGVHVGSMTAKAIASARGLPFIAVNHLEAHALTARLTNGVAFPYLLLLVSGGHCQLLAVTGLGAYELLGTTIDDAIGEAFDKTAKLLGLGFPGGPAVQDAALQGDARRFDLPRPLKGRAGCDFSFSGLKTAVRQTALKIEGTAPDQDIRDLAASFQAAVCDTVADRCRNAFKMFAETCGTAPPALVAAGGVAANLALRDTLERTCTKNDIELVVPPPALCTDNAAMVAWAGLERLRAGITSPLDFRPRPRWPLAELRATE
jgi:N6-L-threonylcarbamoyladenine synthase